MVLRRPVTDPRLECAQAMPTPQKSLLILLAVLVLGAAAGGYYYYKNFVVARAEEQPAKPGASGRKGKGPDASRATPIVCCRTGNEPRTLVTNRMTRGATSG